MDCPAMIAVYALTAVVCSVAVAVVVQSWRVSRRRQAPEQNEKEVDETNPKGNDRTVGDDAQSATTMRKQQQQQQTPATGFSHPARREGHASRDRPKSWLESWLERRPKPTLKRKREREQPEDVDLEAQKNSMGGRHEKSMVEGHVRRAHDEHRQTDLPPLSMVTRIRFQHASLVPSPLQLRRGQHCQIERIDHHQALEIENSRRTESESPLQQTVSPLHPRPHPLRQHPVQHNNDGKSPPPPLQQVEHRRQASNVNDERNLSSQHLKQQHQPPVLPSDLPHRENCSSSPKDHPDVHTTDPPSASAKWSWSTNDDKMLKDIGRHIGPPAAWV